MSDHKKHFHDLKSASVQLQYIVEDLKQGEIELPQFKDELQTIIDSLNKLKENM